MIPNELKMTLEKALKAIAGIESGIRFGGSHSGTVRHSVYPGGFDPERFGACRGRGDWDQPLVNLLPLKQDEDGTIVTQYAMGPVGDLGLLKMDFLGLKTLTVIRNTCEMVQATKGVDILIDRLPLDDAKTYELLNKGNTVGVFQLESGGMRDLCRKFQISSVEHITALIALYRPGPMELIPEFIKRRHGEVKIEYEHPCWNRSAARPTASWFIRSRSCKRPRCSRATPSARRSSAPGHGQKEGRGDGRNSAKPSSKVALR
jgi:DNA polymerase III subunit alpha